MTKAVRPRIKFTYEDYKSLPESETKRYELLGGELVVVPSPPVYHQRISGNLEFILRQFVQEKGLGRVYHAPLDVVLGEGEEREVVQPDIFFISKEREKIIAKEEIRGGAGLGDRGHLPRHGSPGPPLQLCPSWGQGVLDRGSQGKGR